MNFKDIVKAALTEYMQDLERTLDGLTPEERRFRPTDESNHIDFIVWHLSRVEDSIVNRRLRNDRHIWERDGWHKRLGLPREGIGEGFSAEQAAALPPFSIAELLKYYSSVRRETLLFIDSLSNDDLDRISDPERPYWTFAAILGHLIVEEAQHVGQIAYIRGMLRGIEN